MSCLSFNESNIYSASEGSIGFLEAGTIVMENTDEGRQYSLTGRKPNISLLKNTCLGILLFEFL